MKSEWSDRSKAVGTVVWSEEFGFGKITEIPITAGNTWYGVSFLLHAQAMKFNPEELTTTLKPVHRMSKQYQALLDFSMEAKGLFDG